VDQTDGGLVSGTWKRRHLFVHPIQYAFMATTLIYFSCVLIVLYGIIFLPIIQPLDDPSLTWQERARTATDFLEMNARIWPWFFVTFLSLLLHSMYFMHRIAGPLYRFKVLFRSIGDGRLYQRAKLREHDYLHREAQAFNHMLDSLQQRMDHLNLRCAMIVHAYEEVTSHVKQQSPAQIHVALRALEEEIGELKSSLAEFGPQSPLDQGQLDFAGPTATDSATGLKAA